ncbi:hypothetical protein ANCDUO_04334 [Ancylostoma duodenale]|uniref:Nucleotide-diphospho-sugar transferase domain-containing protein n=1 Tax=Ancylostoma duodenale TaxID=51022 RepID=A0A0C2H1B6_9BILA|nr:hypothetical protein ANCDUO_04334 [Ancylostoma duodenale]
MTEKVRALLCTPVVLRCQIIISACVSDKNASRVYAGEATDSARAEIIAHRDSVASSRNGSDSLIHGSAELNGYIVNNIVDQAKIISNDFGSPVYFMMFNEAYKYLALNWLCNTAAFEGTHERLMIVTTSKNACSMIRRKWGTNSVDVVALEPDSIWFKDPYPMFRKMSSRSEVDVASPLNAVTARIGEWRAYSPMLLKPTDASVALLSKLMEKLRKHGDSDLVVYNYLCMARYSGVVCENFLYEDVSDGKWFGLEDTEKSMLRPYILNNNYLNGKKKKEHRQAS